MSSNSNKADKNKKQFPTLNINKEYKGKSVEQKPRQVKYGMQHVGTLKGMRRMPPPAYIPSIRAETGGNDPRVNLVPTGSSGWGGVNGSTSSPNEVGNVTPKSSASELARDEKQDVASANWASTSATSTQASISSVQLTSKQNIPFYGFQNEFPKLKNEEGSGVCMSTGGASDGRPTFAATGLAPVSLRPQTTPSNWLERQKVQPSVSSGGEEPAADSSAVDSLGDSTREFSMAENGLFDVTSCHSSLGMQKPFNSYSRQPQASSFASSQSAQNASNNQTFNSSRDQSSNNHQSDIAATGWAAVDDEPNYEEKIVFSDEEDDANLKMNDLTGSMKLLSTSDVGSSADHCPPKTHDSSSLLADSSRITESNVSKDDIPSERPVLPGNRLPPPPHEAWNGPAQPFISPYGHPFSYRNTSVMPPPHPFYHTRMPLNNAMQPSNLDKKSDVPTSDDLKEQRNARNQDYKIALERAQKKKEEKVRRMNSSQQKDDFDQTGSRLSADSAVEDDNFSSVAELSSGAPGGPPIIPQPSTAPGVITHPSPHMAPHIPPSMPQMPFPVGHQRFVPWQNYPPTNHMHSVMPPPPAMYPSIFAPSTDPKIVEKFFEFLQHQQNAADMPSDKTEDGQLKDKVTVTEQNDPFAEDDQNEEDKSKMKQSGRQRESSDIHLFGNVDNTRPASNSSDQQYPRILKRESSLCAQQDASEKEDAKPIKNSQNDNDAVKGGDHKDAKSFIKKDDRTRKGNQSQPNSQKPKPQPLMEKPIQPANSEVRKFEEKVMEEEKRERNARGNDRLNRSGWDQWDYDYYYYDNRNSSHYRRNDQDYGYQWNKRPRSGVKRYNDDQMEPLDDYLEPGRNQREGYNRARGHPRDVARIPYHSSRGSRGRSYIRGGSTRGRYRETSSHVRPKDKDNDNRRSGTSKTKKEKAKTDEQDGSDKHSFEQKDSAVSDPSSAVIACHADTSDHTVQNRSSKISKSGSRANKKDQAKSKDDIAKVNEDSASNTETKGDDKSEITAAPPPPINIWNTVHPLIDNSKGNSSGASDSNDKSEPPSASRSKQGTPSKEMPTSDEKSDRVNKEHRGGLKSGDFKHTKSERSNYSKGNRRGGSRRGGASNYDEWSGGLSQEIGNKRGYNARRNYDSGHGFSGSYRGDRSSGKSSRGGRTSRGGYDGGGINSSQSNNNTSGKYVSNKNGRDKRQTSVSKDIVSDNNEIEEWETASEGSESMPSHRSDSRRGNSSSEYGGCSNRRGGGSGQGPGSGGGSASGSGSGNYGAVSSNYSVNKTSSSCGENNNQNQHSSNGGKNHRMAGTNNNNTSTTTNRSNQSTKALSKDSNTNEKPRSLPSHIEIHNIASVVDITNLPEVTEDEELLYDVPEQFQEVLSKTTRKKQKLEEQKRQNQIIQEGKNQKGKLGDKKVNSTRLATGRISKSTNYRKQIPDRQLPKGLPPRLAKQRPTSPEASTEKASVYKSHKSSESSFGHSILNKNAHPTNSIKPLLETSVMPTPSLDTVSSLEKPVVIDSWDSRLAEKVPMQKPKTDSLTSLPKPIGTPAPAQATTRSSVEKDSGSRDSGVDTGEAGSSNRSSPKGLPLRSDVPVSKSSARSIQYIAKQVKEVSLECNPPGLSTTYSSLDTYADKHEDEFLAFCHLDQNEIDKSVSVVKDDNCDNTSQERLDSKINSVKNLWYNPTITSNVDIAASSIECGSNSSTVQGLTVSYPSESDSVSSSGVNSSTNQTNICKVRPQLQQQQQQQSIDQRSSVTPTQSPLENVSSGDGVAIVTSNASSNPNTFATSNASQLLPPFSGGNAFPNFYPQQPQPQSIYHQQDVLSNNCFSVETALQGNRWSTSGALPNTSTAYGFIQQPQRPPVNIPKPIQQPMMTQPGAQQPINYNPVIMHKFVSVPPTAPNLQQNQSQIAPVQFAAGGTPRAMPGETPVANNSIASQLFAFYQRQNSATGHQPSIQLTTQAPLPAASNLPQSGNSSGFPGSTMNSSFSGTSASGVNMQPSNILAHQNHGTSFTQQIKPSQPATFAINRQQPTPQQSAFPALGSNPTLAAASLGGFAGSNSLQHAIPQYGYPTAPAHKNIAVSSQTPLQYPSTQNRGLDSLSTEFPYNYPMNSGFASDLASNAYNNSSGSLPAFNNMSSDNLMGFKAIPHSPGFISSSFQSSMFPQQSNLIKQQSSQPLTSQSMSISATSIDHSNQCKTSCANDPRNNMPNKDGNQSTIYSKLPGKTEESDGSIFSGPPFSNQKDKRQYQQNSHMNSQKNFSKNIGKSTQPSSYNRKNSSPVALNNPGCVMIQGCSLGYENTQMTTETAGVLAKMAPEELQRFVMQMRNGPVAAFNQTNVPGQRIGPRGGYQDFDGKKGVQNKRAGNNYSSKGGSNRPLSQTNIGVTSTDSSEIVVEEESKSDEPSESKSVDSAVSSLNRPVIAES